MSQLTPPGRDHGGIQVAGLTKRYGPVVALDNAEFDVIPGTCVALWGPNGAGKTTILRCLLGLAQYTGTVRIDGYDPASQGARARRRVGYVPQDFPHSSMTVHEVVDYVARLKREPMAEGDARLAQLGIAAHGDKAVSALSGGMKQRLALALAPDRLAGLPFAG